MIIVAARTELLRPTRCLLATTPVPILARGINTRSPILKNSSSNSFNNEHHSVTNANDKMPSLNFNFFSNVGFSKYLGRFLLNTSASNHSRKSNQLDINLSFAGSPLLIGLFQRFYATSSSSSSSSSSASTLKDTNAKGTETAPELIVQHHNEGIVEVQLNRVEGKNSLSKRLLFEVLYFFLYAEYEQFCFI
jgi:hypothetical protein